MENRKGTALQITKRPAQIFTLSCFLGCVFLFSAGCGAPGDPVPPSPPVPAAIKDLAGHQAGDGVRLTFTLPLNSVTGEKLPAPPAVEILRGTVNRDGGRIDLAGAERYCQRRACTNHQRLSNLPLGNSSCRSRFASARASAWQARITRGAARFF